jgi:hypothetical protein
VANELSRNVASFFGQPPMFSPPEKDPLTPVLDLGDG